MGAQRSVVHRPSAERAGRSKGSYRVCRTSSRFSAFKKTRAGTSAPGGSPGRTAGWSAVRGSPPAPASACSRPPAQDAPRLLPSTSRRGVDPTFVSLGATEAGRHVSPRDYGRSTSIRVYPYTAGAEAESILSAPAAHSSPPASSPPCRPARPSRAWRSQALRGSRRSPS